MTPDREKLIDSLTAEMPRATTDDTPRIFLAMLGSALVLFPVAVLAAALIAGHALVPFATSLGHGLRGLSETSRPAPTGSTVDFEGVPAGTVTAVRTPHGAHPQSTPLHLMVGVPADLADRILAKPDLIAILDQEVQAGKPIHIALDAAPTSAHRPLRGYVELLVRGDSLPLFGPAPE